MSFEKHINFKPGEHIIAVHRRYLLTQAWSFIAVAILFGTAFFFLFWFFRGGSLGLFAFCALIAIGAGYGGWTLFLRQRNACYVTNERIIDAAQRGLFDLIVSDVPYDQIEDVSGKMQGIGPVLFGYGQVVMQTSGGRVQIILDRVRRPMRIQQEINHLRAAYLERTRSRGAARHDEMIEK